MTQTVKPICSCEYYYDILLNILNGNIIKGKKYVYYIYITIKQKTKKKKKRVILLICKIQKNLSI